MRMTSNGDGFPLFERLFPVLGHDDGVAVFLQQCDGQPLIHDTVLRQEHAQRRQVVGRVLRGLRRIGSRRGAVPGRGRWHPTVPIEPPASSAAPPRGVLRTAARPRAVRRTSASRYRCAAGWGRLRIHSTSVQPSYTGMLTSEISKRKGAPAWCAARSMSNASTALVTLTGVESPIASQFFENEAVRRVVVDNQHADSVQDLQQRSRGTADVRRRRSRTRP